MHCSTITREAARDEWAKEASRRKREPLFVPPSPARFARRLISHSFAFARAAKLESLLTGQKGVDDGSNYCTLKTTEKNEI